MAIKIVRVIGSSGKELDKFKLYEGMSLPPEQPSWKKDLPYTIEETDITQEENDKSVAREARLSKLKDVASATTIAQLRQILKALLEEMGLG